MSPAEPTQKVMSTKSSLKGIPLKQSQIELLQHHQKLQGVKLYIQGTTGEKIAFVEAYDKVW